MQTLNLPVRDNARVRSLLRARAIGWPLLLLSVLLLPAACTAESLSPPPDTVTVQLSWLHYGAFGGFYAADQRGNYAEEALAVTFAEGGPQVDPTVPVAAGEADFGVTSADSLLLARAQGRPVRAIATILRRSPAVLIAPAASGISRPEDIAGHKVRMTTQIAPDFRAMMSHVGISPDQYEEVVLPSELALFASGEVPVWGIYYNSFAVTLQEAGHDLNFIFPGDYGVHAYGDVIFASEDLLADDPELVIRFLRATLQGWHFAVENPEEIGPMVAAYDPEADPALESAKMRASVPLIHTGRNPIGWMRAERWQEMYNTLSEQGVLPAPVEVEEVYTMAFLHEIYGEQR